MTSLLRSLLRQPAEERAVLPLGFDEWLSYFTFNGLTYAVPQAGGSLAQDGERIEANFEGYVQGAYKRNGVVFACMLARMLLFSEARFMFRQRRSGRPGDLFSTRELGLLERPWPNATTGTLLTRMIVDVDMAGNAFVAREGRRLRRLRPDWTTIIIGSETDSPDDGELVGYAYQPGGPASGNDLRLYLPEQVAHFAPIPDPVASFRGMSWLTPVLREILADGAATEHKLRFFENGATPNMVVTMDPSVSEPELKKFAQFVREQHEGLEHAYKTLFLGGGATAQVVGSDMRQVDFKVTQGAGETRIAAAAGVPPVIVGLSEGLQAATYSNYAQARRRFADGTIRPLWRSAAGALQTIIDVPSDAELWYDDRDIPFLQEDVKDDAEIQQARAITIRELINAGYDPESVVDAVNAGDLARLKHTGLVSVQLHDPKATLSGEGPVRLPSGDDMGASAA